MSQGIIATHSQEPHPGGLSLPELHELNQRLHDRITRADAVLSELCRDGHLRRKHFVRVLDALYR